MKDTYATEIGMLGIWDRETMSFISSPDEFEKHFLSGRNIAMLMNKGFGVFWETGGDGHFEIDVRVNPQTNLSSQEENLIALKTEGHKLVVTSDTVVGSPSALMDLDQELKIGTVKILDNIENGTYKVDIYFVYDHEAVEGLKPVEEDLSAYIVVLRSNNEDEQFEEIWDTPNLG